MAHHANLIPSVRKEYPILWWTPYFEHPYMEGRVIDRCGLPYTCTMTHDRSFYNRSRVVVFHAPMHFRPEALPYPDEQDARNGSHIWVMHSLEAPQKVEYNVKLANLFSYMWTYSFKADFTGTYFTSGRDGGILSAVLTRPAISLQEKNRWRQMPRKHGGRAAVAWVVSHCPTFNFREKYVRELQRHMVVDVFGKCGDLPWPRNIDGKELSIGELVSNYKFFLALENENCDDYVTEKLENPLRFGTVPIVDGPNDYSKFSPSEKALIRLDAFESPAKLAEYLRQLDRDDSKYLEHLSYRIHRPKAMTTLTNVDLASLSKPFVEAWDNTDTPSEWGPDEHGAQCKVCKLQHDMTEGITVFDPNKRIGLSKDCRFGKHKNVPQTDHEGNRMIMGSSKGGGSSILRPIPTFSYDVDAILWKHSEDKWHELVRTTFFVSILAVMVAMVLSRRLRIMVCWPAHRVVVEVQKSIETRKEYVGKEGRTHLLSDF